MIVFFFFKKSPPKNPVTAASLYCLSLKRTVEPITAEVVQDTELPLQNGCTHLEPLRGHDCLYTQVIWMAGQGDVLAQQRPSFYLMWTTGGKSDDSSNWKPAIQVGTGN